MSRAGAAVLSKTMLSSAVLSTVLFLAAPGAALAQAANPVFPPGLEPQVGALVFRGSGDPLGNHIEVANARIEGDRIEVDLARADTRVGRVWLTHRSARMQATRIGTTASFAVWLADGAGRPGVRDAAEALRARVAARDDGALRDAAGIPTATGMRSAPPTLGFDRWRRGGLWIALLALLAFLATRERTFLLPAGRTERLALLALVAVALGLRLGLPSWAPLHANEHGIAELRALSGAQLDPHARGGLFFGDAYFDLVRTLLAPFGVAPNLVLALGALFGALAVLLLHRVVALLVKGPWGPGLAALGLALHPTHVRLSLSESPRPLAGALLLLGIACGLLARRATTNATRAAAICGAAIAFSLAAELRVITVVLPMAGLAFVLIAGRRHPTEEPAEGASRRGRAMVAVSIALGLAILGATIASHLGVLGGAIADGAARPPVDWMRRATAWNVLFDPELTALVLLPFALGGAVLLWRGGERRLVIACAVAVAILVPPSLFVCACRTDAIRYQSEAHLFLFVALAGFAPERWSLAWRPWLVVPVLLVGASIPGLVAWTAPDLHERAFMIAGARAPSPPVAIVVPPREMRGDRKVRSDFPDYRLDEPTRVTDTLPEHRDRCVVWVGPACWSFTDGEIANGRATQEGGFRDECRELLGGPEASRAALERLAPVAVPHRDQEFHRIPVEHPRLGFAPCPRHAARETP